MLDVKRRDAVATALRVAVLTPFCLCAAGGWARAEGRDDVFAGVVSVLPVWPGRPPNLDEPEGSGVVVLDGRHVVTALHVIGEAERIDVRPADGRRVPAVVVGADVAVDLALLRIDYDLPTRVPAPGPLPGEPVCAVGNGSGLGLSIACGVVSAIGRTDLGFNPIEDFIQTDAAVNPGHSGGALLDRDGGLVGVISAIFSRGSDANIGINFALAAPLAMRAASEMAESGAVSWSRPGARTRTSDGTMTYETPAGGTVGVVVEALDPEGPLAIAGLEVGDILLAADGRALRSPGNLVAAAALRRSGEVMKLLYARGSSSGASRQVEVRF